MPRSGRQAALAASLWAAAAIAFLPLQASGQEEDDDGRIYLPAADDPVSPETFDQRLSFAQAQAESTEGACGPRLDSGQRQRDVVAASPLLEVMMPDGRARLANIDYRLHIGRAVCGSETAPRKEELQAALDSAMSAVGLYRDLHDYQSMAVMQYDVAAAWRLLGDKAKSLAELEAAVAMDREFGFVQDGDDNAKILAKWKGQPVPPEAAPPAPRPAITLKFAWASRDANVAVEADYLDLAGGQAVHSKAETTAVRHIRPDAGDWAVTFEPGDRHYDFGDWKDKDAPALEKIAVTQAAERMWLPKVKVTPGGQFKELVDAQTAADILAGEVETLSGDLGLSPKGKAGLATDLHDTVGLLATAEGLSAAAAQDHTLATSAWIDSTLEQGVWYEMKASLLLPGMVLLVDQDIRFTYARPVPCTEGAAEAACAEILVHATPDGDALDDRLDDLRRPLKLKGSREVHYDGGTDLRLVVEPGTLLPHASEIRRHWYIAIDGLDNPLIGTEKIVSVWSYPIGPNPS